MLYLTEEGDPAGQRHIYCFVSRKRCRSASRSCLASPWFEFPGFRPLWFPCLVSEASSLWKSCRQTACQTRSSFARLGAEELPGEGVLLQLVGAWETAAEQGVEEDPWIVAVVLVVVRVDFGVKFGILRASCRNRHRYPVSGNRAFAHGSVVQLAAPLHDKTPGRTETVERLGWYNPAISTRSVMAARLLELELDFGHFWETSLAWVNDIPAHMALVSYIPRLVAGADV
jgi:hypothetical protein